MPQQIAIRFAKFHGLHNDFIVARARHLPRPLSRLAQAITHRHAGIGADGFLVVHEPRHPSHDARVRFFNADGSEAEMSGNGIRCVGALLLPPGRKPRRLQIETRAGIKTLEPVRVPSKRGPLEWTFRVSMGQPIFDPARIPFRAAQTAPPIMDFPLALRHRTLRVTVTSMGNPHCSIFVDDFESLDWRALGQEIERSRFFPRRTNVEFIKVISRREIEVRFWERGVGETASSGTGSCGAAVASILNGRTDRTVRVQTSAGSLLITWPEDGEVTLTGPAIAIAEGKYYWET